ncbi:MAG: hypothetical protein NPMRD1_110028 [Nitrosopumilales archaeon]|nr:MAG: hypothetical protein NPMRD1_110028 [Nitrosopumilales archaeon]
MQIFRFCLIFAQIADWILIFNTYIIVIQIFRTKSILKILKWSISRHMTITIATFVASHSFTIRTDVFIPNRSSIHTI